MAPLWPVAYGRSFRVLYNFNVFRNPLKISVIEINPTANSLSPGKLKIVSRSDWLAQPPVQELKKLVLPIPYVVISHTETQDCSNQSDCIFIIRNLQTYHIESTDYYDIAFNFMVGGDGSAYEGRGWKYEGAHTYGYNSKSLGIGFVGTFNKAMPTENQLLAAKQVIEKGVMLRYIAENYQLFGERQLVDTSSPGDMLFEDIKTWPHWTDKNLKP